VVQLNKMYQALTALKPFSLGIFLLLVTITLQSSFAIAQFCASSNDQSYTAQFHILDTNLLAPTEKTLTSIHQRATGLDNIESNEECFDCDCKCCPCCSSLSVTLVATNTTLAAPNSFVFNVSNNQLTNLFYSLLRPPKHQIRHS